MQVQWGAAIKKLKKNYLYFLYIFTIKIFLKKHISMALVYKTKKEEGKKNKTKHKTKTKIQKKKQKK